MKQITKGEFLVSLGRMILSFMFPLFLFVACDNGGGSAVASDSDWIKLQAETEDDLPACTAKREGSLALIDGDAYLCEDKHWNDKGTYYATEDSLANCTAKREGEKAYIADEGTTLKCTDGEWLNTANIDAKPSSSSTPIEVLSSSSTNPKSSSSTISSSESDKRSSSSAILSSSSSSTQNISYSAITDSRDGQEYKIVTIGTQTWMAENLNYETDNSYCYDDLTSNCSQYGRLYTWAAAMDSAGTWSTNGKGCGYGETCSPTYPVRGVCPSGWHLPTKAAFETLIEAVGGSSIAGTMLKSTTGWNSSGNGTDDFGFSAFPAGSRSYYGYFSYSGDNAFFWSATEFNSNYAYFMNLYYYDDNATLSYYDEYDAQSVRCLRD